MTTETDNQELIHWEQVQARLGLPARYRFGETLRNHRKSEGWTQQQAALRLGMSKQMLSQVETGKRVPSLELGTAIAQTLGMYLPEVIRAIVSDQIERAGLEGYAVDIRRIA